MTGKLIASEFAKTEKLNGTNNDSGVIKLYMDWFMTTWNASIEKDGPILENAPNDVEMKEYKKQQICDKKAKSLMLMLHER